MFANCLSQRVTMVARMKNDSKGAIAEYQILLMLCKNPKLVKRFITQSLIPDTLFYRKDIHHVRDGTKKLAAKMSYSIDVWKETHNHCKNTRRDCLDRHFFSLFAQSADAILVKIVCRPISARPDFPKYIYIFLGRKGTCSAKRAVRAST